MRCGNGRYVRKHCVDTCPTTNLQTGIEVSEGRHVWGECVLPTFAGEAVRRDPRQAIFADVAKGGPCVGAGVPVVHP